MGDFNTFKYGTREISSLPECINENLGEIYQQFGKFAK